MTQHSTVSPRNKPVLYIGIGLVAVALLVFISMGVFLLSDSNFFRPGASGNAILFIDVPGRIAIDGTLQIEGPAPVLVSDGSHTLSFFDAGTRTPVNVSVAQGEFQYVAHVGASRNYSSNATHGSVYVSAFPPNTTIEIPDCTPLDVNRPTTCKSNHVLSATLSPGTYTIKYTNPQFGDYEESITVAADSSTSRDHSFITTVVAWEEWRTKYGNIVEQSYPRYYRGYHSGGALLLPFEAAGEVAEELFF